jgi:GNAT superfamily N-acetyltransferase
MPAFPPFHARPIDPSGRAEALALAADAGLHGVYLRNDLAVGSGDAIGLYGEERMLGCLWFGVRGNLVVVEQEPLDPARVADAVQLSRWPWRIALGPQASLDALAQRLSGPPLVLRDQVYYGCMPGQIEALRGSEDVRFASRADRDRLVEAGLDLNHRDLSIRPDRVDRRWIRDAVSTRIADGTCLVLGAPGAFHSKLDLGSRGAAGLVIEGVYTFPESRGLGHAAALVAAAAASYRGPVACLHVNATNSAARRAYERAGLRPEKTCRLLLCN